MPIGGFLSAQLAEIWCVYKEYIAFFDKREQVQHQSKVEFLRLIRKENVHTTPDSDELVLTPLEDSRFLSCLSAQTMVHRKGMGVSQSIALVKAEDLHAEGLGGWWEPIDLLVGTFRLSGTTISVATPTPWDGAAGGRCEMISRMTDNLNKGRVRDFFQTCTPL